MAPLDLGPAILAETSHDVFAGPYHRNNDGNAALIKLMLAPLPAAKQILSDRHVDYVRDLLGSSRCEYRQACSRGIGERGSAVAKRPTFWSGSTSIRPTKFRCGACENERASLSARRYSSRSTSRSDGNSFIHRSATTTVATPPSTAEATVPSSAAATPLSN